MGLIYKATCMDNGKVYVGQTHHTLEKRWDEHVRSSARKTGAKDMSKLARAIRKHGASSFSVEIIECVDDDLLDEREIYWIDLLDSYHNGYNSTLGGDGSRRVTKEVKEMIFKLWDEGCLHGEIADKLGLCKATVGEYLKGYGNYSISSGRSRGKRSIKRKVRQYDIDGVFVREYESIVDAAKAYNVDRTLISGACRKKYWSAAGFQWRYAEDEPPKSYIEEQKNKRPVMQYSIAGEFIKMYESIKEAAVAAGLSPSSIDAACVGKSKTSGGSQWRYADSKIPVQSAATKERSTLQFDLNGNKLAEFPSMVEASRQTGVSYEGIANCCYGNVKSAGGFQWRQSGDDPPGVYATKRTPRIPVVMLDVCGNQIGKFDSINKAALATGTNHHKIADCIRGKIPNVEGIVWRKIA